MVINKKKISIYEKINLNLWTKTDLLYRNVYPIQSKQNLNFDSDHLIFTKFQDKNLNDSDKIGTNGRFVQLASAL